MKTLITFISLVTFVKIVWIRCDDLDITGSAGPNSTLKACMDQTNVTQADIEDFIQTTDLTTVKENVKCHVTCMMGKNGVFKNGAFNDGGAIKFIFESREDVNTTADATTIVQKCKVQTGATDCDTGFNIGVCFLEA